MIVVRAPAYKGDQTTIESACGSHRILNQLPPGLPFPSFSMATDAELRSAPAWGPDPWGAERPQVCFQQAKRTRYAHVEHFST
jgi:hypothetical protein